MGGGWVRTVEVEHEKALRNCIPLLSGILSNPGQVTAAVLEVMLALQNITYFKCQIQCALLERISF